MRSLLKKGGARMARYNGPRWLRRLSRQSSSVFGKAVGGFKFWFELTYSGGPIDIAASGIMPAFLVFIALLLANLLADLILKLAITYAAVLVAMALYKGALGLVKRLRGS